MFLYSALSPPIQSSFFYVFSNLLLISLTLAFKGVIHHPSSWTCVLIFQRSSFCLYIFFLLLYISVSQYVTLDVFARPLFSHLPGLSLLQSMCLLFASFFYLYLFIFVTSSFPSTFTQSSYLFVSSFNTWFLILPFFSHETFSLFSFLLFLLTQSCSLTNRQSHFLSSLWSSKWMWSEIKIMVRACHC